MKLPGSAWWPLWSYPQGGHRPCQNETVPKLAGGADAARDSGRSRSTGRSSLSESGPRPRLLTRGSGLAPLGIDFPITLERKKAFVSGTVKQTPAGPKRPTDNKKNSGRIF